MKELGRDIKDRLYSEPQDHYYHHSETGRIVHFTTKPPNPNKPRTDLPSQFTLLELLQGTSWVPITKEQHHDLHKQHATQVPWKKLRRELQDTKLKSK